VKIIFIGGLFTLSACTGSVPLNPQSAASQVVLASSDRQAIKTLLVECPRVATWIDAAGLRDDPYGLFLLKRQLLLDRVNLVDAKDQAQDILTPIAPVHAVETKSFYAGLPPIKLGPLAEFPALAAYSHQTLIGITRLAYVVQNRSGGLVGWSTSGYGFQPYSVQKSIFWGESDSPKLNEIKP
jgi:hypothetical protein